MRKDDMYVFTGKIWIKHSNAYLVLISSIDDIKAERNFLVLRRLAGRKHFQLV